MKVEIGSPDSTDQQKVNVEVEDFDAWNVNHTLALIAVPLLKKYKEINVGCHPGNLEESLNSLDITYREENPALTWAWVIDQMIQAFEHEIYCNEHSEVFVDNESLETSRRGLKLFAEFYFNLWD